MTALEKKEVIKHKKDIIGLNIYFRVKHPNVFSDFDVESYRKQKRRETSRLRRFLKSGGEPELDKESGMYIIPSEKRLERHIIHNNEM